ncbi:MAG: carboxypeptidase-like regulatory domain-containing protein [Sphingobacteriia bacterium]|nr:MAG: carboxypeptidase-like regulatory domain-containing protein [Sphingobacteriia bacterium]
MKYILYYWILLFLGCLPIGIFAQSTIKGRIMNEFTKETVPFASVQWSKAKFGVLSDSTGEFNLKLSPNKFDSLVVNYVGYQPKTHAFNSIKDTGLLFLALGQISQSIEVQVKSKFNKGLRWWNNIIANKSKNNPEQYNSFSYTLYNKLEIDLNNLNKEKFKRIKLLQPFGFVLDNIDSISEEKPFLPVFLTETISKNYFNRNPAGSREEIIAQQTHGLKNESILQFINGINQHINLYQNELNFFGKEFISPLSNIADKYYNFKGADTITIGIEKYFHLLFSPKTEGENTFKGDCWIHSSTWAVQRISLDISASANINFVRRLSISQEFKRIDSAKWIFAKDIFVAEVSPLKKEKFSFIGRKTKLYSNVNIDDQEVIQKITLNRNKNEIIQLENSKINDKEYWKQNRTEPLSMNETKVIGLIDTLKTLPIFKKYSDRIEFIFDGHKRIGAFEIGPWYKWVSGNPIEQFRVRFDLGTTDLFNKNLRFHTYLAYGFKDNRIKGKFDVKYKIPGSNGWNIFASYINDLDNGKIKYNDEDVTTDNLFSQLIRRPGIPQKFLGVEEYKFGFGKDWPSHLSMNAFVSKIDYQTYTPLPTIGSLSDNPLINTELVFKLRYAAGEQIINTHRKDFKVRSNQPVYEVRFGKSVNGLFNGEYNFTKFNASIKQQVRIPRFGQLRYNIYGGKIWSNKGLPFMLLELHPGNEIYYFNKESFNLMNRFEYFSDRFVGINLEHNIEKKLLNLLPFMRKSPIRQFWNFKTVWGNLDLDSRALNRTDFGVYRLRSLRGDFYTEFGTGFDNIARFFRIDFVWRANPYYARTYHALVLQNKNDFGIFASFRIQF